MNDNNFEKLARKYPDLFQKSGDFEFSIGDGWYGIIDVLCGFMSYDVSQARYRLKYANENQGLSTAEPVAVAEARLTKALEELPTIAQVKEKFGGLRFYIDGGRAEFHSYIDFAESMSTKTCEICGKPGEIRQASWLKSLCDEHQREKDEKEAEWQKVSTKPKSIKLSDE